MLTYALHHWRSLPSALLGMAGIAATVILAWSFAP